MRRGGTRGLSACLPLLAAAGAIMCAPAYASDAHDVAPAPPKDPFRPRPYVNPFTSPAWIPARTDMGVDWVPKRKLPVRAIGNAVILGSNPHNPGWPGHHIIWYQLLDGDHAGDVIYVAEHLKSLAPAGKFVVAGQRIAIALPGSPYTEWGWANAYGAPLAGPCYTEGKKTRIGKEMARFMIELGATPRDKPGSGPDAPQGGHCV